MGACCSREEELQADFSQDVNLAHFELVKEIGKGAFGKVKIVKHKQTGKEYALKYIAKDLCVEKKAINSIILERVMLEDIHCPFVCNLRYAFQDDEYLFMVIDLKPGGDLRYLIGRVGALKEDIAKFMIAEVMLGIMYLHSRRVVHKDIKPENILLDAQGHTCLTDFNLAAYYTDTKLMRRSAGTMVYMAPEIFAKTGYNQTIDWWSLGVLTFELVYGKRPFRGKNDEEIKYNIVNSRLKFQDDPKQNISPSQAFKDLCAAWLVRDIKGRLGAKEMGGESKLLEHPWFTGYDWDVMNRGEGNPLFVPDAKGNYDVTFEIEDALYEDKPLKATKRKVNAEGKGVSKLSLNHPEENAKFDKEFRDYDFTKPKPILPKKEKVPDLPQPAAGTMLANDASTSLPGSLQSIQSLSRKAEEWDARSEFIVMDDDQFSLKSCKSSRLDLTAPDEPLPNFPKELRQSLRGSKVELETIVAAAAPELPTSNVPDRTSRDISISDARVQKVVVDEKCLGDGLTSSAPSLPDGQPPPTQEQTTTDSAGPVVVNDPHLPETDGVQDAIEEIVNEPVFPEMDATPSMNEAAAAPVDVQNTENVEASNVPPDPVINVEALRQIEPAETKGNVPDEAPELPKKVKEADVEPAPLKTTEQV